MDGAIPPVLHMPSWYVQGYRALLMNTRNVSHVTPVKNSHVIIIGMVSRSFVSQNNMLSYELAYKQYMYTTSNLVSCGHAADLFRK